MFCYVTLCHIIILHIYKKYMQSSLSESWCLAGRIYICTCIRFKQMFV